VDDPERIADVMRACGYEAELCGSWDVCDRLPSDPHALGRYSIVVLSDVEAWRLSSRHWEALDQYVRSGGGLLLVGGAYGLGAGGWDACPLVSMLPVVVEPGCEWRPVRVAVTAVDHPLARAVPWAECPEFRGMNPVRAKDLGFVVLSDRVSGMPLLAVRQWGRGCVAAFSSDITAVWGAEFNRWEHFPVFMKVLLDCLASRPPGFGGKEAAAAGAAAGAVLSVLLNWLRSLLEIFAGFAERKELQWAARVSRYVLKWLEDASAYGQSLRLARRWLFFWERIRRGACVASPSVLLAEAAVEGAIAFENAPAQALRAERLAKAVDSSVRVLFCGAVGFGAGFVVGLLVSALGGGPLAAAVFAVGAGFAGELAARPVYDGLLSGRLQTAILKRVLGMR
jgi:uncharacterized membrane protein